MTVELRPLGVNCNIQCQYCYQNPQRDAGNLAKRYDLDVMMRAIEDEGGPFALFGGEPLMIPLSDLETLWKWGLARYGHNSVQTNGVLITDEHVRLFHQYRVQVGLSLDGPSNLNDARWAGSLERTREATARVEAVIEQLCREQIPPTLIVTLHRGNATSEKLPAMREWLKSLERMGVRSARLHLLEVDHSEVRRAYALSPEENCEAVRSFAALETELTTLKLDLFDDVRRMLRGLDDGVTCVWGACDPYTTSAVRGVEGNGQRSNCGRTNKDGIDFSKASTEGFERYLALYHTPQEHGGCQDCRFFLFCKGQCPGTALDNDWRNRSEHCPVWMESYERIEKELVDAGEVPLSISPLRAPLEKLFLSAWESGHNTTLAHGLSVLKNPIAEAVPDLKMTFFEVDETSDRLGFQLPSFTRVAWSSDLARDVWAPRMARLKAIGSELEWRAVAAGLRACAVVPAPVAAEFPWTAHGLSSEKMAGDRLLVGRPDDLSAFGDALDADNEAAIGRLLGRPQCCTTFLRALWVENSAIDPTWSIAEATTSTLRRETDTAGEALDVKGVPQANWLWRLLGLRPVSHTPCRFDCPEAVAQADAVWGLARELGFDEEIGWLTEILSWPVEWTALHGIAEIRTPVLKISTRTDATKRRKSVRWTAREGAYPAEGAQGVRFPYLTPRKPRLTVSAGYRRGLDNTTADTSRIEFVTRADTAGRSEVLDEVLAALEAEGRVEGRSLRDVHLTSYFTVVRLDDGSVGAGMSYYRDADSLARLLPTPSPSDPLLLGWLFRDPDPVSALVARSESGLLLVRSLRTAVLSALSAPLLGNGGGNGFEVASSPPIDPFSEARRAVVIGFGGYVERLAEAVQVEHLHVCDLGYASRRTEMDGFAESVRSRHPHKRITFSDGSDAEARIKAADALAITGSALCNGTMDRLLSYARGGPVVVVQGQSAALHPLPFFRRGVRMIATTLKPQELAVEAAADPSGQSLRPFLEGGLPWVYLVRSAVVADRVDVHACVSPVLS